MGSQKLSSLSNALALYRTAHPKRFFFLASPSSKVNCRAELHIESLSILYDRSDWGPRSHQVGAHFKSSFLVTDRKHWFINLSRSTLTRLNHCSYIYVPLYYTYLLCLYFMITAITSELNPRRTERKKCNQPEKDRFSPE